MFFAYYSSIIVCFLVIFAILKPQPFKFFFFPLWQSHKIFCPLFAAKRQPFQKTKAAPKIETAPFEKIVVFKTTNITSYKLLPSRTKSKTLLNVKDPFFAHN
jgi:hypothetical protein